MSEKRKKVFYVGRINIEKNIPFLTEVWQEVVKSNPQIKADLVMVGEGRYRKWADKHRKYHAYFLGPVEGENLSKMYASADLFVFPSITDTLDQVVMETQASGVSCMVSDIGGPQTLVIEGQTGQVLEANNQSLWVKEISKSLLKEDSTEFNEHCFNHMQQYNIQTSYKLFMEVHQRIYENMSDN